ncbi:hypothetical protein Tco_0357008 [Tanacetum coccineum]
MTDSKPLLKTPSQDIYSNGFRVKKGDVEGREAKRRHLGKGKHTISEEQPSKKLSDLSIIWATVLTSSDDDFWKDQEEWEIIRWRFHESSGVHTLEIEDGTMIHMLAERRYPLSRELMIKDACNMETGQLKGT